MPDGGGPPRLRAALDRTSAPRPHPSVAVALVDDQSVIGHEALGKIVVLDAISTVLWQAANGSVTLGDLADDLAASAAIPRADADAYLGGFFGGLAHDGFLDTEPAEIPRRRREFYTIPPESCLGAKIGLSRAEIVQIEPDNGPPFRVASTLPDLLGFLTDLPRAAVSDEPLELFLLRATGTPRRPRLQQLFDSFGNLLWAGDSLEAAPAVLQATVGARLRIPAGGAWAESISFVRDGRAVLVHKLYGDRVGIDGRRALAAAGITATGSGLLELVGPGRASRPVALDGEEREELEIAALIVPHRDRVSPGDELRFALHLARAWDQAHFDRFADLWAAGLVRPVARGATTDQLVTAVAEAIGD